MDVSDSKNVINTLSKNYPKQSIIFLQADVRKRDEIANGFAAFVKQFKFVDIVIGGAGIANDLSPEETISINLVSLLNKVSEMITSLIFVFFFYIDRRYTYVK